MRRLFQIAILAAGLDYISKMLILNVVQLPLIGRIEVFPPFLNFHMAWNYGVNFGLFAHDSPWTRWVLIAIAVGVSVLSPTGHGRNALAHGRRYLQGC